MSEKNTKNNFALQDIVKKSLITALILSLLCVSLSFVFAFLLNMTSTPEIVYPYSGYIILAVSSYVTAKLYLKNLNTSLVTTISLSSFIIILITALIALAVNNGKTTITPIIIKFCIVFLLMLFSSASTEKKKRKKKNSKRR